MSNIDMLNDLICIIVAQIRELNKEAYEGFSLDMSIANDAVMASYYAHIEFGMYSHETVTLNSIEELQNALTNGGWAKVLDVFDSYDYTGAFNAYMWYEKARGVLKLQAYLKELKKEQAICLQNCQMRNALKEALNK